MHDLTFNLMEHLGLLAVLEDKNRVAALEAHAAARAVDLTKAWMALAGHARAAAKAYQARRAMAGCFHARWPRASSRR